MMKKFTLLMTALLCSFAFTACDDAPEGDAKDPIVKPEEEKAAKIAIEVKDVQFASVVAAFDPGEYEGIYYAAIASIEEYEAIMDGSKDPQVIVDALMLMERNEGTDLEVANGEYVFSGAAEIDMAKLWSVTAETEYYIIAFPIKGRYGDLNGDVSMKKVETPEAPMSDVTFEIEMSDITDTQVNFLITPSDENVDYFYSVYNPETIERYAEQGDEFFHFMELAIKGCKDIDHYTAKGIKELSYEGLAGNTEYTLVVFAVNKETDPISPYSAMVYQTVKTKPAVEKPELPEGSTDDFAIDVVSLDSEDLVINVTPKSFEGNYVVCAVPYSQLVSDYGCDMAEYSATVCYFYAYLEIDFNVVDGVNICNGTTSNIHLSDLVTVEPGGCYIVSAFGVNPDEIDPYKQVITGVSSYIEIIPAEE